MTRAEVESAVLQIICDPNTMPHHKVGLIFGVMGKLSPEPKIKSVVPKYNAKRVRRVGTLAQRIAPQITKEDRETALKVLREMGLI